MKITFNGIIIKTGFNIYILYLNYIHIHCFLFNKHVYAYKYYSTFGQNKYYIKKETLIVWNNTKKVEIELAS